MLLAARPQALDETVWHDPAVGGCGSVRLVSGRLVSIRLVDVDVVKLKHPEVGEYDTRHEGAIRVILDAIRASIVDIHMLPGSLVSRSS